MTFRLKFEKLILCIFSKLFFSKTVVGKVVIWCSLKNIQYSVSVQKPQCHLSFRAFVFLTGCLIFENSTPFFSKLSQLPPFYNQSDVFIMEAIREVLIFRSIFSTRFFLTGCLNSGRNISWRLQNCFPPRTSVYIAVIRCSFKNGRYGEYGNETNPFSYVQCFWRAMSCFSRIESFPFFFQLNSRKLLVGLQLSSGHSKSRFFLKSSEQPGRAISYNAVFNFLFSGMISLIFSY